jgi:hypothetical protein
MMGSLPSSVHKNIINTTVIIVQLIIRHHFLLLSTAALNNILEVGRGVSKRAVSKVDIYPASIIFPQPPKMNSKTVININDK